MGNEALIAQLTALECRLAEDLRRVQQIRQQLAHEPMPLKLKSTRGRKSMGAQERREVSARLKRYWAGRRGEQQQQLLEVNRGNEERQ